ncbi:MAG: hypothetical protein R3C11_14660 [Planctomycetaceae bacterium]
MKALGSSKAVFPVPSANGDTASCSLKRMTKERAVGKRDALEPVFPVQLAPEDVLIERFRALVVDAALSLLNEDLALTEKFTSSLKDGLDLRETIRHWHTGELYVKTYPPNRGSLDSVVMLFDSPADPRDYPWRTTWHAEHEEESTLCFYASSFEKDLVGPGIGRARYGGAWFLYPPVPISDIWQDPKFDFTETLEERLLAAACHYSREKHVVLLSNGSPGAAYRRLAKHYGKKWLHIPLSKFSQSMVEALRTVHVLNGKQVRSYAANFIRKRNVVLSCLVQAKNS